MLTLEQFEQLQNDLREIFLHQPNEQSAIYEKWTGIARQIMAGELDLYAYQDNVPRGTFLRVHTPADLSAFAQEFETGSLFALSKGEVFVIPEGYAEPYQYTDLGEFDQQGFQTGYLLKYILPRSVSG